MLAVTFIQGIYNYVPETGHGSKVYRVAAVLYLQYVIHVVLFRPVKYVLYSDISTSPPQYVCSAQYGYFCLSLILCFFRYVAQVLCE
jgi:hypothetical protein